MNADTAQPPDEPHSELPHPASCASGPGRSEPGSLLYTSQPASWSLRITDCAWSRVNPRCPASADHGGPDPVRSRCCRAKSAAARPTVDSSVSDVTGAAVSLRRRRWASRAVNAAISAWTAPGVGTCPRRTSRVKARTSSSSGRPSSRTCGASSDLALASSNAGLGAVQRYHGVPPYAETQGYITRIRSWMASYADPIATAPGAGPPSNWVRPIQGAPITSGFGYRWGRLHAGIDFGTPIGTAIYAASDGTVIAAGPIADFGQWVKILHPATSPPSTVTSAAGP